ncbi:MAG: CPBP family intramembrane glutamic endopeptidase [Phycisphaerales bacterium JB040]
MHPSDQTPPSRPDADRHRDAGSPGSHTTGAAIGHTLPSPFEEDAPTPDPGTPASRLVALVAATLLAVAAIVWQHLPEDTRLRSLGLTPPPPSQTGPVIPLLEPTSIYGRMAVKLGPIFASDPTAPAQFTEMMDSAAFTVEDRVAGAVVLGELKTPRDAADALRDLRAEVETAGASPPDDDPQGLPGAISTRDEILRDLDDFRTVYVAGSDALDPQAASRLRTRYAFFAEVALTHDAPEGTPERREPRSGGAVILVGMLAFAALAFFAFVAGCVLLVLGLLRYVPKREVPSFVPPAPGGSVMLETYALFVGGFVLVSTVGTVLSVKKPELAVIALPLQFALMGVVAWPLLRGMKPAAWRRAMGLTAGAPGPVGVLKEIGFGFLAYLAAIPVFVAGIIVTLVLLFASELLRGPGDGPVEPPSNPIVDMVASGDWLVIALLAVMATIWAPITEELVFRGALYRHVRARLHWTLAALLTTCLFAFMHGYPFIMMTPLLALGVMFAIMREIRGSVIAAITAHFIHNATLITVMVVVIRPMLS